MKIQRVCSLRGQFYKWKWIVTLKKWGGVGEGGVDFYPRVHDKHGVIGDGGGREPLAAPYSFFKSLSISIGEIVHVINTHAAFSCGLYFSSDKCAHETSVHRRQVCTWDKCAQERLSMRHGAEGVHSSSRPHVAHVSLSVNGDVWPCLTAAAAALNNVNIL